MLCIYVHTVTHIVSTVLIIQTKTERKSVAAPRTSVFRHTNTAFSQARAQTFLSPGWTV